MEDDNYITIQGWMINRLGLSGNDLIVYAIIYGFSQDGENWYTGNQKYLADSTKTSVRTVIRVLNRLLDKGYIEKREVNKKGVTLVDYRATTMSYPMSNCHKGTDKMSHTLCQNVIEGTDKMSHHNTRNIYIEHKKEINKEKNQNKHKNRNESKFTPPSLEEVKDYIYSNDKNVNPEEFWNFYESNGWKVGKNKMKSWHSAVATWHARNSKSKKIVVEEDGIW